LNVRGLTSLKQRVAREAAVLLYTSQEKEYKQAKQRAAQNLGIRVLPSNKDVAQELDKVADEIEGSARQERLLQMRREALKIMKALKNFHPKLIGSVWRGTAHKDSDIDIVTFSSQPTNVLQKLEHEGFEATKTEWQSAPKLDKKEKSFHIYLTLPSGNEAEVVVRSLERMNQKQRCEIYGDTVTGLNYRQLERLLEQNPLQKFTPYP
jgi:predicted nucleotidyltransferase